jgi:hypothetical protein
MTKLPEHGAHLAHCRQSRATGGRPHPATLGINRVRTSLLVIHRPLSRPLRRRSLMLHTHLSRRPHTWNAYDPS